MTQQKMKTSGSEYILNHALEAERLERQARCPAYNYLEDLVDIDSPSAPLSILDAGCGSGILARALAQKFPQAKVLAIDVSHERITEAEKLAKKNGEFKNLSFGVQDLRKLEFKSELFDLITLRYVAEHQTPHDMDLIVGELYRVLKPGGKLRLVDIDGCMFNLFPLSLTIKEGIDKLKRSEHLDLFIGRKLPFYCKQAGFDKVDWSIKTWSFQGDSLAQERQMMAERLEMGQEYYIKVFGGVDFYHHFCEDFDLALSNKDTVLFYNKFIVTAIKK